MALKQTPGSNGVDDANRTQWQQIIISACQNFAMGVIFTGLPILICVSLSVEMTHTSWAQVGRAKLIISTAIPLMGGVLAIAYGQRFTTPLSEFFESLNVPF